MDIWVKQSVKAFIEFRMPVFDMSKENFLNNKDFDVFSFGVPPVSIDLMTAVKGLDFEETYANSQLVEVENLVVRLIHYNDLIKAKKSSGRHKDMDDIENLSK